MKNHRVEYSIEVMCDCFGVSRSGYYAWLQRKPSRRSEQRQHLDERSGHCLQTNAVTVETIQTS